MEIHTFIAPTAADAVAQIREKLGPEAVVLNVRKLPGEGLARLWQKPQIEVLACVPDKEPVPAAPAAEDHSLSDLKQELAEIRQRVEKQHRAETVPVTAPPPVEPAVAPTPFRKALFPTYIPEAHLANAPARTTTTRRSSWNVVALLETMGLLPIHAQRIGEELQEKYGETPPESMGQEIQLASEILSDHWHRKDAVSKSRKTSSNSPFSSGTNVHILVGPPGVGKTTCLCKWLANAVLLEGRRARVWRLDGRLANTAESLSVYAEILGVPVERFASDEPLLGDELLLIDLPGVNWHDAAAVQEFTALVNRYPEAQVHLVLNAAYETSHLLKVIQSFSSLPLVDLIFTHLDEEPRWGKLWNFVLGTNYSIGFLSAGQNVPGDFHVARPENILSRQFPCK